MNRQEANRRAAQRAARHVHSHRTRRRALSLESLESRTLLAALTAPAVTEPFPLEETAVDIAARTHVFRGWVGPSDTQDRYRFELADPARVAISLDELAQDLDLYLFRADGTLLARSARSSSHPESIEATLDAGHYQVLVTPWRWASGTYRLSISADTVRRDSAGDDLPTARDLGAFAAGGRVEEFVGGSDPRDVYRLEARAGDQLEITLSDLQADLDLFLLDEQGRVLARSWNSAAADEQIRFTASAATHYVLVQPYAGVESSYTLGYSATRPSAPDAPPPMARNDAGPVEWNVDLVAAPQSWARGYHGDGVTVAIVDSGIDLAHPEFASRLWVNADEIAGNGIDDDRNGFIDDRAGWDFANGDNDPRDGNGHGTHVAGIVAAARDGAGITGVAFGATIMPVQVVRDNGSGSSRAVADGIRYAVDNGADIINLSLGGLASTSILAAIQYAADLGVLVVAAAGNATAATPTFPAAYSALMANVISVGAMSGSGAAAPFSNRVGDSRAVQVDAPGVSVLGATPGGSYGTMSGTSMASPHVAGVAALVWSAAPDLNAAQVRELLVRGADAPAVGSDSAGRVNASASVALAEQAQALRATLSFAPAGLPAEPAGELATAAVAPDVPEAAWGVLRAATGLPAPTPGPARAGIGVYARPPSVAAHTMRPPGGVPAPRVPRHSGDRLRPPASAASEPLAALDQILEAGSWEPIEFRPGSGERHEDVGRSWC